MKGRQGMEKKKARSINMLLGIGNELNGDDAVGCYIADNFSARNWLSVNAGTVPGNFTGLVKREKPPVLVIVDAADMNLQPGEIRRLKKEQANSAFYSTHSLPISEFISQVESFVQEIVLLGVQPRDLSQFAALSDEAREAAQKLAETIRQGKWKEIPLL